MALPRIIEFPSSSWKVIRRPIFSYGKEAYLEFNEPEHLVPNDLLACGTACSTWVGHVRFVDHTDPEIITVVCDPLYRSYQFQWWRRWQVSSVGEFGQLSGQLFWDGRWIYDRKRGVPYNPQLVGECAVGAYPGGDVSIIDMKDTVFFGRSGHAETFEGYQELRAKA